MITRYVNTASTVGTQDGTTSTAGNSGTSAFATLAQALDSLPGTLVDAVTINCSGTAADTAQVNQAHWDFVTSAANYILVQGDNTTGKYDTSKYRIEVTNLDAIYNNNASHVRLANLQVQLTVSTSGGDDYTCYRLATANNSTAGTVDHRVSNCIAKIVVSGGATDNVFGFINSDPTTASGGTASGGTCRIWNCIAYGGYCGFSSDGTTWATNNLINYNCTAYGNEINFLDVQKCLNCLATANTSAGDFLSTGTTGHSNNASGDASAGGTNARINQTFTFVNAAAGDFHLQSSDAGAKDHGLTDPGSGLFSDDIDGQTRSGTWDIGADEYVNPGTTITPDQAAAALTGRGLNLGFAINMPDEL